MEVSKTTSHNDDPFMTSQDSAPLSPSLNDDVSQEPGNSKTDAYKHMLRELTKHFNNTVKLFWERDFDSKLESAVLRCLDQGNQSSQDTSVLDQTFSKPDYETRIAKLEELLNAKNDKINTKIDDITNELGEKNNTIEKLIADVKVLKHENKILANENLKLRENQGKNATG